MGTGTFNLFNNMREKQHTLIVASQLNAKAVGLKLPDLESRLSWGITCHLNLLDDRMQGQALQRRARSRSFDIPDDVLDYIVKRVPRDTHSLFKLLDRMDDATLSAKKKLTIPFVKALLDIERK